MSYSFRITRPDEGPLVVDQVNGTLPPGPVTWHVNGHIDPAHETLGVTRILAGASLTATLSAPKPATT